MRRRFSDAASITVGTASSLTNHSGRYASGSGEESVTSDGDKAAVGEIHTGTEITDSIGERRSAIVVGA